ncbi:MAG: hypothetical protein KKF44_08045 [Nanoarchaeota archaeon]|nr:hypothetical protein [Nanoarchaeota archaeon]
MRYLDFQVRLNPIEQLFLDINRFLWPLYRYDFDGYAPGGIPYPQSSKQPIQRMIEIIPEEGETLEEIIETIAVESYKTSIPKKHKPSSVYPAFPKDCWVDEFDPSAFYTYRIELDDPRRGIAKVLDLFLPPRVKYRNVNAQYEGGVLSGLDMDEVIDGHLPTLGPRETYTKAEVYTDRNRQTSLLFNAERYKDGTTYLGENNIVRRDPYALMQSVQQSLAEKRMAAQ